MPVSHNRQSQLMVVRWDFQEFIFRVPWMFLDQCERHFKYLNEYY